MTRKGLFKNGSALLLLSAAVFFAGTAGVWAIIVGGSANGNIVAAVEDRVGAGVLDADQNDILAAADRFDEAFEIGDQFFALQFNGIDGSGANVGGGERFTRVPRADRVGATEWANHTPARATGPNAQGCFECHNQVAFGESTEDGAGRAMANVHRDPLHAGTLNKFIQRNTPHLFGNGGLQRLAEEMTADLKKDRQDAVNSVCAFGGTRTATLDSKGVNFGSLSVTRTGVNPCKFTVNTANVKGVDTDLVVKPFQWKGSVAFTRDFARGAAHNEIGIQAVEITGDGVDGDGDGIKDEASVGALTGLATYQQMQPRPTTRQELASLGLIPALTSSENAAISRGSSAFSKANCDSCHRRDLDIVGSHFGQEPSASADFRDATFPAGQSPTARGVDPNNAVKFDLTKDHPDNVIRDAAGNIRKRLGDFETDIFNNVEVNLFGDLKRHDMGSGLAEQIDETGSGASVFMTENLWGVGATAPYLHDGRSTTLTGAILEHGGEAAASRDAFKALSLQEQKDLIAFLNNLTLFKQEPE